MASDPSLTDPELLLRELDWTRALARKLVFDPNRADDLVQDAWLSALQAPPQGLRRPRAWLAKVLRNVAKQVERGEARRRRRDREVAASEVVPSAEDLVSGAELQGQLVGLVIQLEEPYRTTILLRFFQDMEVAAIAVRMEVASSTVHTRLGRGLALLRECLDREHDGDRSAWALGLLPLARAGHGSAAGMGAAGGVLLGTSLVAVVALTALSAWPWLGGDKPETEVAREDQRKPWSSLAHEAASEDLRLANPGTSHRARQPSAIPESDENLGGRGEQILHGIVVELESGQAVPGAEVFRGATANEAASVLADEEGRFRLRLEGKAHKHAVTVVAEGFGGIRREITTQALSSGEVLRFPVVRGGRIEGQVLDPSQEPVAGAELFLRSEPYPQAQLLGLNALRGDLARIPADAWFFPGRDTRVSKVRTEVRAISDEEGRFVIDGIVGNVAFAYHRVQARHPSFAPVASPVLRIEMPSDSHRLDLVLEPGVVVEGRVLWLGQPSAADVWWEGPRYLRGSQGCDASGSFRFDNVPAAEITLHASLKGFRSVRQKVPLDLSTKAYHLQDFDFDTEIEALSGVVLDAHGTPLAGVAILAWGENKGAVEVVRAKTDPLGNFTLELPRIAGRSYSLRADRGSQRLQREGLLPGAPELVLRFPELGWIQVRAVDSSSLEAIDSPELFWRKSGQEPWQAYRGERDLQRGYSLPLGHVDLMLCAHEQGYRATQLDGVLVGEPSKVQQVALRQGAEVQIKLEGEAGGWPKFHFLFLLREEQAGHVEGKRNAYLGYDFNLLGDAFSDHLIQAQSITSDQWGNQIDRQGQVHLTGLAPGTYTIGSMPADLLFTPAVLVIPPDGVLTTTVRWREIP